MASVERAFSRRRKRTCEGKALANTAVAPSCGSFGMRTAAASMRVEETPVAGVMLENIEYNATLWSGPADFPVFGRVMSSVTATRLRLWGSAGSLRAINALKSCTELARTVTLLDFALLIIWASRRWKDSTDNECLYEMKN